jgi:predicted peroxiredoxin
MKTAGSKFALLLTASSLLLTTHGAMAKARSEGTDPSTAAPAVAPARQTIVVPLTTLAAEKSAGGTFWLLKSSTLLASKGASVTLMLYGDGARLADTRSAEEFHEAGDSLAFWNLFGTFVEAGGEVLVETTSAEAIGLTTKDLRPGTKLSTAEDLAALILKADKVVSFTGG